MLDLSSSKSQKEQLMQEVVGSHLLLSLKGCSASFLDDELQLRELTQLAAQATGATVLEIASHRIDPLGVRVLAVLAESHASLYTYPQHKMIFWDCFMSGDTFDPALAVPILMEALRPTSTSKQLVFRS